MEKRESNMRIASQFMSSRVSNMRGARSGASYSNESDSAYYSSNSGYRSNSSGYRGGRSGGRGVVQEY